MTGYLSTDTMCWDYYTDLFTFSIPSSCRECFHQYVTEKENVPKCHVIFPLTYHEVH